MRSGRMSVARPNLSNAIMEGGCVKKMPWERPYKNTGPTEEILAAFADLGGADTRKNFWFLGGPMGGGIPRSNEPAFRRAASTLRARGYNICNPVEFRRFEEFKVDKDAGLAEGIKTICHEKCVGLIVLPGWLDSNGTLAEAFVADSINKPINEYSEKPLLTLVKRVQAIEDHERKWIGQIADALTPTTKAEKNEWVKRGKSGDPVPRWDERSLD